MHHCIASFAPRIYSDKGQSYVYHLEAEYGERATMLIRQFGEGWKIVEIRGVGNVDVSDELLQFVDCWLRDQVSGGVNRVAV